LVEEEAEESDYGWDDEEEVEEGWQEDEEEWEVDEEGWEEDEEMEEKMRNMKMEPTEEDE
jgi:hypothetical protein